MNREAHITLPGGRRPAYAKYGRPDRLPGARLVTYETEAHFPTLCNHLDEVARAPLNT